VYAHNTGLRIVHEMQAKHTNFRAEQRGRYNPWGTETSQDMRVLGPLLRDLLLDTALMQCLWAARGGGLALWGWRVEVQAF
jgi:hypothetical protein